MSQHISFIRPRAIPVLLALVSALVLATRLDLGFERVRIGVRGPHVVDDGRIAIDLPPLDSLAGSPAAIVLQLRGGSEPTPIDILFDGRPIKRMTLRPSTNARVDAAVRPSSGGSHYLELLGTDTGWRVRDLEVANVHGFSKGPLGLMIVPRGRTPDQPLPWVALVLISGGLLLCRPRWDWPRVGLLRVVHRAAAALVLAALTAILVADWVTPFRIFVAPGTMVLALVVLYAERVYRGATALPSVFSRTPAGPALAGLMASVVLLIGVALGSRGVGGADVYGYVSQARLLGQGQARVHQPIAAEVPWPDPDWTLAPLGYAPGGDHTIVPTYPPGLPLLILLASPVFGELAPFLVAPIGAATLVLLTYALGARISSPLVGLAAAGGIATSPTVLLLMLTPMSDVPVSAFWMASLLLAYRRTTPAAFAAGLAAGVAILIRPNLVFLAPLPLVVSTWNPDPATPRIAARRAAAFVLASAPFALFIGWWFNELYGSPLRSGYGDNAELFRWQHVADNLARYPVWLWNTQGPLVYLAALSPLVAPPGTDRFIRLIGLAGIGLVTACYLLYVPFDAWWYLRFLIVALPLLFILSADVCRSLGLRLAPAAGYASVALFTAMLVYYGLGTTWQHRILSGGRADQKYADVGLYVLERLPANAVVYSMQHSGTIRYYSDAVTVRWTHMKTDWMDRSVDWWVEAGYEPMILLDDWEVPEFLDRFGSTKHGALVALKPPGAACTHAVFVYRLIERPGQEAVVRVPRTGCE